LVFLAQVLAAGAEPSYLRCLFDRYTDLGNGLDEGADEVIDNFPALAHRAPRLLADFIRAHAD
jgi:NAD(P)H dehydrogenase (quinone)